MISRNRNAHQHILLKALVFCLLFTVEFTFSQAALTASGGEAVGNGGSLSYTIGQVVYIQTNGTGGTASQGVQQAFTITVLGNDDFSSIELKAIVFPNPTTNYINLTITNVASEDLSYRLFDINRRLISSHKIKNHETIIPMERLASATYLLYVLDQNTQLKVFKIIKE
ncbi:T9SS type A sorting domain-containing protein [Flavobacteriaceae bacterium]|jgi:hypothetical protein|nr:T9SS type A sorting domain-containing protein [Flavobacteriaceae bacterium]|tara:strand:- start:256 stop:762 length:507 start_codon:yes stop_codon:yes gene_type:complete